MLRPAIFIIKKSPNLEIKLLWYPFTNVKVYYSTLFKRKTKSCVLVNLSNLLSIQKLTANKTPTLNLFGCNH